MIDDRVRNFIGFLLCSAAMPLAAQTAGPPAPSKPAQHKPQAADDGVDDNNDIYVVGRRQPGAVIGNVEPEVQLSPADIRSYGVSTITELLDELSPQTTSGRGRGEAPVVLLNGKRISGLSEIRDIPTEAIRRVDILPEEVALKYGYRADQKVVNFVLRPRFRAVTGELEGGSSTEGGRDTKELDTILLRIQGDNRINIGLRVQDNSRLQESDRDIVSTAQGQPFDTVGNITAPRGAASNEIDPALSAIAGQPVTIAGVPVAATTGRATIGNFATLANTPNATDVSPYRSLVAANRSVALNAVLSRPLFDGVQATFNASLNLTNSDSDQGLPGASLLIPTGNPYSPFARDVQLYRYPPGYDPNEQHISGNTAHLGVTLNGNVGDWRWTATGTYDRTVSNTRTDRGLDITALQNAITAGDPTVNPFGMLSGSLIGLRPADRARSKSDLGDVELVANGTIFHLPAGDVSGSVKVGAQINAFDARSTRNAIVTTSDLSRDIGTGQINVDVPITSRKNDVLGVLGELSANGNFAVDRISRFGTLKTIGYGVNWIPVKGLNFIWSVTDDRGAPTVQQLGDPVVSTPDVRVFDYANGTSADITRISGGNPALTADHRHVTKLGFTLKPAIQKADLSITANYVSTRTRNAIASFPAAIAQIEAAFPDRFTRDQDGNLTSIDSRPIQFAREDVKQLRWGINFSKSIETAESRAAEAQRAARRAEFEQRRAVTAGAPEGDTPGSTPTTRNAPGGGAANGQNGGPGGGGPGGGGRGPGGPGGPGGGRFGGGGFGGGAARVQLAVYHTWYFKDDILIRPGVPVLDLLGGSATGSNGGQPQHVVEVQAGGTWKGFGTRVSANWQSATTVNGGAAAISGGAGSLRFSSLATANFRLFANLGQMQKLTQQHPWLRGTRVTINVSNLFDTRLKVHDANGLTPLSYQPGYIDPVGRSFKIGIRKLFF